MTITTPPAGCGSTIGPLPLSDRIFRCELPEGHSLPHCEGETTWQPQYCNVLYERPGGRERGDRVVGCGLAADHAGPHTETETGFTWTITTPPEHQPSAAIKLGQLALQFGRVNRATYHPDGTTPESDTDHTVMLGLIACALAPHIRSDLDVGLVAQYALVHDLVEAYANDTHTLRLPSTEAQADKQRREQLAYLRIAEEFAMSMPWLVTTIAEYEARRTPEARYVKALDKLMPKITHFLNGGATIREQGMSFEELRNRYEVQADEMRAYADDFPALFDLREELVTRVLMLFHRTKEATAG